MGGGFAHQETASAQIYFDTSPQFIDIFTTSSQIERLFCNDTGNNGFVFSQLVKIPFDSLTTAPFLTT